MEASMTLASFQQAELSKPFGNLLLYELGDNIDKLNSMRKKLSTCLILNKTYSFTTKISKNLCD